MYNNNNKIKGMCVILTNGIIGFEEENNGDSLKLGYCLRLTARYFCFCGIR